MPEVQEGPRQSAIWESGYLIADRYEVVRCLGIGSMGIVYLCRHRALDGFLVALKVLAPHSIGEGSGEHFYERFKTEILATRSIDHPNVVHTYDYVSRPNLEAFSMEYMPGGDLANYLRRGLPLDLRCVTEMLIQMCAGVQAIHDANFMHRDLKPENFLLSESRQVKVADFGVARAKFGPRITARGGVVGTLQYLSPQYLESGEYTRDGDIYSLGTLAYEMITGSLPFGGHNMYRMLELKVREDPPPPQVHHPQCPESLSRIVMKAIARNARDRYELASDMGQELLQLLQSPAAQSLQVKAKPHRSGARKRSSAEHQISRRSSGTAVGKRPPRLHVGLLRGKGLTFRHASFAALGLLLGVLPVLSQAGLFQEQEIISEQNENLVQTAQLLKKDYPLAREINENATVIAGKEIAAPIELEIGKQKPLEEIVNNPSTQIALSQPEALSAINEPFSKSEILPSTVAKVNLQVSESRVVKSDTPKRISRQANPIPAPAVNSNSNPSVREVSLTQPIVRVPKNEDIPSKSQMDINPAMDAAVEPAPEFKVRATLLYRFVDYVEWPKNEFSSANQTIHVCIVGRDPFGSYLDTAVQHVRSHDGRALQILRYSNKTEPTNFESCQLLYLTETTRAETERVTTTLRGKGVLIVSEDTGRGMVNFVVRDRKVKFEIDQAEAAASKLEIKPVLLDLAVQIRGA